jgi:hypothetical protein
LPSFSIYPKISDIAGKEGTMTLREYFEKARGRGVLATADMAGNMNAAVYAKPKIIDEDKIAFIMRDRLSHANVSSNPHATYLFIEHESGGYKGVRLYITKLYEEEDTQRLFALRRPDHNAYEETEEERGPLFLVVFQVDRIRGLTPQGGNPLEAAKAA